MALLCLGFVLDVVAAARSVDVLDDVAYIARLGYLGRLVNTAELQPVHDVQPVVADRRRPSLEVQRASEYRKERDAGDQIDDEAVVQVVLCDLGDVPHLNILVLVVVVERKLKGHVNVLADLDDQVKRLESAVHQKRAAFDVQLEGTHVETEQRRDDGEERNIDSPDVQQSASLAVRRVNDEAVVPRFLAIICIVIDVDTERRLDQLLGFQNGLDVSSPSLDPR